MDSETRELLNAIIGELDRVEQKIYGKIDEVNSKLDIMQKDINLLTQTFHINKCLKSC